MPATASGSFGTVQLPDTNYLFDAASGKTTADVARQQLANQLASNTLGSNTQIAANVAEGGSLANQVAAQRGPLEIAGMRQQLGIDPSPTLDRLTTLYNGGAQPAPPGPQSSNGSADIAPTLASRESGSDPSAVNAGGYSGMFQQGAARLSDPGVGVYTPAKGEDVAANTWQGTFNIPGFPDVKTHADFLASPGAQKAALAAEVVNTNQAIASTPGADKFSTSGLQAVAHLGGVAGMQKFVATGGAYNPTDANGTHLSDYYNHFAQGGPAALQATFGHPDGPPQPSAAPGVTVAPAPVGAAPAPAPIQTAARGAIPGGTATDATAGPGFDASGNPLPAGSWDASPVAAATPPTVQAPVQQPAIQNPNALLGVAAPAGPTPPAPVNALAGPAPVTVPPAPVAPTAQPGTGMNSPQVQQAQELMRRATQIEMAAAATPNDPRAKMAAAAMASDLRARAQVIMQADSVTVDPVTGIQTHTLTGKQDPAAQPVHNPARVTKAETAGGTLLTQPGSPDRLIPFSGRPEQVDAYKSDLPRAEALTTAAQSSQASMPRLNEMADLASQLATGGAAPELRAKAAAMLEQQGVAPATIKEFTGMDSGSAAQLFTKLAISTAGAAAKADVGANNGIQSTQLYQSANPGMNLLPDANTRVTNMMRVSAQQIQDYAQAALQHFGANEQTFLAGGNYAPLTTFNRQWLAQSNPQIGAAAIGILNGDPFEKWSAKITPAEGAKAAAMAGRVDPTIQVPLKGGGTRPVSQILAHPAAAQ